MIEAHFAVTMARGGGGGGGGGGRGGGGGEGGGGFCTHPLNTRARCGKYRLLARARGRQVLIVDGDLPALATGCNNSSRDCRQSILMLPIPRLAPRGGTTMKLSSPPPTRVSLAGIAGLVGMRFACSIPPKPP